MPGLGADGHLVAPGDLAQQGAEDLLGLAVGVAVRGVDERPAGVQEGHQELAAASSRRRRRPTASSRARGATRRARSAPPVLRRMPRTLSAGTARAVAPRAYSLRRMQLGLNLGYWGAGNDADEPRTRRGGRPARVLPWSWVAEAYGSDAPTVLAWVGAQTERIDLGSAVMQIPARTPAMTAMTAATLDTLSGGRFRLGLGVSGPQVSEGWHGVPFAAPLGRTREYVDIVRMALRRETVAYQGKHWHAAAAGRPRQGPEAHRPPGAAGRADLPRRGRAEEPRAGRRDRRRLAGDLLQPGARR